jgi:hypothetical protein
MKACRVHHFGPPDVIPFENVARPHPGEGEVLIRVKGSWSWALGCLNSCRQKRTPATASVDSGVRFVRHCRSHRPVRLSDVEAASRSGRGRYRATGAV